MFAIIFFGVFFGLVIFIFSLIASKKNGKFYLAPLVTFLSALIVTAYGLFKVGGFEGMSYGFLGTGIGIVAISGTLFLPFIISKFGKSKLNRMNKVTLIILPLILFATIGFIQYTDENYWIINSGVTTFHDTEENKPFDSYYRVSTISEGSKQIHIQLGEKYLGKMVEVENVKGVGNTEVTLKMVDGGEENKLPYIQIGVDQIVEPLKIETKSGEIIHSQLDALSN